MSAIQIQPPPLFLPEHSLTQQLEEKLRYFIAQHYPDHVVEHLDEQGGCSYTFKAYPNPLRAQQPADVDRANNSATIIQFRLFQYAVPIAMAELASRVYSPLAPATKELGQVQISPGHRIQALGMSCIDGKRFSDVQPRTRRLDPITFERLKVLFHSLSTFFAMQWCAGKWSDATLASYQGRVGSSIAFRLGSLERHLPSEALRERARWTREAAEKGALNALPTTLTHGDLIPSNIMIDRATWQIKGYIDWAEAEMLPYGLCQYGVEHLLGYLETEECGERPRFIYYEQADELRATFTTALEKQVPEMASPSVRAALALTRNIGIFLWQGFAWDDGRIDRVINPIDDARELAYLEAFMGVLPVESIPRSTSTDESRPPCALDITATALALEAIIDHPPSALPGRQVRLLSCIRPTLAAGALCLRVDGRR